MIKPDDDFEDDFDNDMSEVDDDAMEATATRRDTKSHDTRRKIEEMLEKRRLKDEFGDILDL